MFHDYDKEALEDAYRRYFSSNEAGNEEEVKKIAEEILQYRKELNERYGKGYYERYGKGYNYEKYSS